VDRGGERNSGWAYITKGEEIVNGDEHVTQSAKEERPLGAGRESQTTKKHQEGGKEEKKLTDQPRGMKREGRSLAGEAQRWKTQKVAKKKGTEGE